MQRVAFEEYQCEIGSVFSDLDDFGKSICGYQIVPYDIKILQNFWLILYFEYSERN